MERKRDTKSGAGKIVRGALFVVLLVLLLGSCEQMFTFSPLSWAQRDPANLSDAQKIAYAESVLGSGDADAMADAYNAIKDSSDPDVQLLASKLALGASGINEAIENALANFDAIEADPNTVSDYINTTTIDPDMLDNAINAMYDADADSETKEDITQEDYLVIAASVVIRYSPDVDQEDFTTGYSTPDKDAALPDSYKDLAAYYLQEGGYSATDLEDLINLGTI
ncbi:MAG: hypothetical protein SVR04_03560 [Spirochaetota bacterium]|nr:hypothetical protein [Spirochaetota bacterium]